jgi:hypothetical protein
MARKKSQNYKLQIPRPNASRGRASTKEYLNELEFVTCLARRSL